MADSNSNSGVSAGNSPTATAPTGAPSQRVLGTSMSSQFLAGDSGGEARVATFDDIFGPPEPAVKPAGESEDEQPATTDQPPPPVEEEQPAEDAPTEAESALEALAAEHGLDLSNAKHRALLEKMIAGAENGTGQATEAAPQADDEEPLTEYEKALLAPAQPAAGQPPPPPQAAPLPPGKFGDILDDTSSAVEAWERYTDAFRPDEEGNLDFAKVNAVGNAIFKRQAAAMIFPAVQQMIAGYVHHHLGPAVQYMQQFQDSERRNAIYGEVLLNLKKEKGYEKLDDLFKPLSDRKLKFGKDEVDDNAMNRILKNHPEILDVQKFHQDPDTALRLTQVHRMRAIMRHHRAGQQTVRVPTAQALVQAGAQIEQKKTADAARQRLNSGPSAGPGGSTKSADDRWFEDNVLGQKGRVMDMGTLLRGHR